MRTAKEIWYARNPVHDVNIVTGQDMFDETMEMCMKEYAAEAVKEALETVANIISGKQNQ